jgi:hypothetical protein
MDLRPSGIQKLIDIGSKIFLIVQLRSETTASSIYTWATRFSQRRASSQNTTYNYNQQLPPDTSWTAGAATVKVVGGESADHTGFT